MAGSNGFGGAGRLAMMAAMACIAGKAGAAMPGLYFAGFYMDSTLAYSTADAKIAGFDVKMQEAWVAAGGEAETWTSGIEDKTDIGYAFSVGFQFSQYLAGELGYVDMGTVHYASVGTVSDSEGSYNARTFMSAKSKGLVAAAIGIWPLGDRWSLDARAGLLVGKTRLRSALYVESTYIGELSEKDNRNSLVYGAGVNWAMSPGTAIRVGYSRMAKAMIDRYDVGSWTLGLKYAW